MNQGPAWRPSSDASVARSRARMLHKARNYFAERDVLEVETPHISPHAVSDVHIESIGCKLAAHDEHYLRTSPEFAMKRLLAAGYPDLYEIGRVFRDGEFGRRHQPEFTMVEWYRKGFDLPEIIEDTLGLIQHLLRPECLAEAPVSIRYSDAFNQHLGLNPLSCSIDALSEAAGADKELRESIGSHRDDWLDLLLSRDVSAKFANDRLTVLYHYPASQAALARISPDDATVADRFEVFYGSMELANGYVELTDCAEQQRRFEADQATRESLGRPLRPLDANLLAALMNGLPQCAGVALGFDRVLMINENTDDIRKVVTFSFDGDVNSE